MAGSHDDMVESEALWEKLLPADHLEILSRAVDPVEYSSKKELYFRLHQPLLLDGGTKSFVLDAATGKKSYMLSARELGISWGDNDQNWSWVGRPDSRFAEVAELLDVCWLDIHGDISSRDLSCNTTYAAYLVFKLHADSSYGFAGETQKASISVGATTLVESVVHLDPPPPSTRKDGWAELCLGEFDNCRQVDGETVRMSLREVEALNWKKGLIVEGIEVRPKEQGYPDQKRCAAHGLSPLPDMLRCFPAPLRCFTAASVCIGVLAVYCWRGRCSKSFS